MLKALHVVAHEKFLPHIIDMSELINPNQNRYVAFNIRGELPYEQTNAVDCLLQQGPMKVTKHVKDYLSWCNVVFLHPLNEVSAVIFDVVAPSTVVVWCGMGGDYYKYSPIFKNKNLLPLTHKARKALQKQNVLKVGQMATNLSRFWRAHAFINRAKSLPCVARRVDFFCAREHDLKIDQSLPGFRAKYLDSFSYYTMERAFVGDIVEYTGLDILLGNSALWSNNHIDLFPMLKRLDFTGRKIVLPLNYGSSQYADIVEREARSAFGSECIVVLRKWMRIDEYKKIIENCGTVFINSVYGQAMGNISAMLARGAKVFLRPENPYLTFFEQLGVAVSRIPDYEFDDSLLRPLSADEKARNAALMRAYWGASAVEQRLRGLFDAIAEEMDRRSLAQ